MELNELNDTERVALVALMEFVIESNSEVSDAEVEKLEVVVEAVGADLYEAAADEVDRQFEDEDALREFLPSIKRQDARELIYATVLDTALSDAVNHDESDLLTWLEGAWSLTVRTDESDTPA